MTVHPELRFPTTHWGQKSSWGYQEWPECGRGSLSEVVPNQGGLCSLCQVHTLDEDTGE